MTTALVTGAASGLGRTFSVALARNGYRVAGLDVADLGPTAREVAEAGGELLEVPADVTDPAAVRAAVDGVAAHFGELHVVVNNAGVYPPIPFADTTIDDWHRVMTVNLDGPFLVTSSALPHLRADAIGFAPPQAKRLRKDWSFLDAPAMAAPESTRDSAEVVVVGSGAGGGLIAAELGRCGHDVLLGVGGPRPAVVAGPHHRATHRRRAGRVARRPVRRRHHGDQYEGGHAGRRPRPRPRPSRDPRRARPSPLVREGGARARRAGTGGLDAERVPGTARVLEARREPRAGPLLHRPQLHAVRLVHHWLPDQRRPQHAQHVPRAGTRPRRGPAARAPDGRRGAP